MTFIQHMNDHLLGSQVHRQINLLLRPLFVAIVKGVDHALANRHADPVAVVLAKSRRLRHPQTHLLCDVDAFDLRLQRDFQVLGIWRHADAVTAAQFGPASGPLWVTYRWKRSQWSSPPKLPANSHQISTKLASPSSPPGLRVCITNLPLLLD